MNYHCSQEQAAGYSEPSCSDSSTLDMSSGMITANESSPKESKTDSLTKRQSLQTCVSSHSPVQLENTEDLRTWLAQGSPANRSAWPESEKPATMNEICGRPRWTLSKQSVHPFASLKTCPDYLAQQWTTPQVDLFTTLERYSETWPKAGTMQDGACWELTMLAHHTTGKDCGYWPTPDVRGFSNDGATQMLAKCASSQKEYYGMAYRRSKSQKEKYWPTPAAQDAKNGTLPPSLRGRDTVPGAMLRAGEKGALNPDWVEWLMGWPIRWSSLDAILNIDSIIGWEVDPSVANRIPRVTTNSKNRAKRLKAIGNGQVSLTAATAWKILTEA